MKALPQTKPHVHLGEFRILETAMQDTEMEDFDVAAQAIVTFYKLHNNICLKDEVRALRMKREAAASNRFRMTAN